MSSTEKPTPPATPEPGQKPAAGTELTYQQLEQELTKNTTQVMDACKAAIATSEKNMEAKIEATVKAAIETVKPRPNGKGVAGPAAGIVLPGLDDAQRLNNMFAPKGNLRKAGLELAAAAKRMGSLTADVTVTDPEEAEQDEF